MCIGEILAQEALAQGGLIGAWASRNTSRYARTKPPPSSRHAARGGPSSAARAAKASGHSRDFGLLFGLTFQMLDDLADGDHGLDPRVTTFARGRRNTPTGQRPPLPPSRAPRRSLVFSITCWRTHFLLDTALAVAYLPRLIKCMSWAIFCNAQNCKVEAEKRSLAVLRSKTAKSKPKASNRR